MRFRVLQVLIVSLCFSALVFGQEAEQTKDAVKDETKPATAAKPSPTPKLSAEEAKGINLVESSLLIYSNLQGRRGMDQIRKTWVEFGTLELTRPNGEKRKASYEYRVLRGESIQKAKVRMDQRFPDARYALIYDGETTFGVVNNSKFTPASSAVVEFNNRVWRGLPALFRYRESGSKVEFVKDDKILGVEFAVVRLTNKEGNATDFYISKKSFRILMVQYEEGGIKYKRKFYDYNYAQGTLFPYRTVLWANDKIIEEQRTQTVTFGQEFEQEFFAVSQ